MASQTPSEPPVYYPTAQECAQAISDKLLEHAQADAYDARCEGRSCAQVQVPDEDQ